ncbi:MAG: phosphoribosylformimino-5-aminoimidazole carboxamide ribotide isomerase [Verrucomicrobiota bacterium]|nr:phosphoribosylformimino-5-aminoimidazole carboxamide ribotide isomerase [Verrucomicrobiota bacterium]
MFRPCIDLHEGKVKQIVGGSLTENPATLQTNFISERPASWYAELYRRDDLKGGHLIMLGAGNEAAARGALKVFPGGLQIGGGINLENAPEYLDAGASHVIVTSWIFPEGQFDGDRLKVLTRKIGQKRLVLDLSCRRVGDQYFVVTDRWQKFTELVLDQKIFNELSKWCDEFLIHAADVEGLCRGVDLELVEKLSQWISIPVTYAGGARSMSDLEEVTRIGKGKIDLTIGSALDIFGGSGIKYEEAVAFNERF